MSWHGKRAAAAASGSARSPCVLLVAVAAATDVVMRSWSPLQSGIHGGFVDLAADLAVTKQVLLTTQIALEARQTASATLGSLQEQGNQLKRVNRDVDDVRFSICCGV